MESLIKDIITRLEILRRCNPYADYHLDVSFEESSDGDWVSFYDIEELINEIKEGNVKTHKPTVSTELSIDEKSELASELVIDELRKQVDNANQMFNMLNNNTELI